MSLSARAYFNPTQISGCQLWLDAADPLGTGTAPSSGTTINSWKDKSGNTNHATGQVSAATGSDSVGAFLNFQGTNYYTIGSGAFIVNKYFTIFIVERLQSSGVPGAYQHHFIGNTTPGPTNGALHLRYANTTSILMGYYGNDIGSGNVISAFTTVDAQPDRMFTFNQLSSGRNIYINSSNVASDTNTTLLNGWASPVIGQSFSGYYYVGKMREMIFYTGELSTAQRQQVEGYLAQKWGIQGQLPQGHPGISYPFYRAVKNTFTTQSYSTAFSPLSIAGCQLWLDGADSSSVSMTFSSGSNLSVWKDKSTSANNFNLISGTPNSVADGGKNAVYIPSGAVMRSVNQLTVTTSSAYFIVCKLITVGSGSVQEINDILQLINIVVGAYIPFIRFYQGVLQGTATSGNPGNTNDLGNGNYYVNGTFNPNFDSSYYLNKYVIIGLVNPNVGGTTYLSISDTSYPRPFLGNIGEIICYPGGVTSNQRQTIESYLAQKWGITSSLPSNHLNSTAPAGIPQTSVALVRGTANASYANTPYYNVTPVAWSYNWQKYLQSLVAANSRGVTATVNLNVTTASGTNYQGFVLAPNGYIYCIPCNNTAVGYINPATGQFGTFGSATSGGFVSGALASNGNIYCMKFYGGNIGIITPGASPASSTWSETGPSIANNRYSCCFGPDGLLYIPSPDTANIGVYTPGGTYSTTYLTNIGTISGGYAGAVLAPNGKIYCIPGSATNVGVIDTVANTFTVAGLAVTGSATGYRGGVLGGNGKIYCLPDTATKVGVIDPVAGTFTDALVTNVGSFTKSYMSGTLGPDGKIYCISGTTNSLGVIDVVANTFSTIGGSFAGANGIMLAPNGTIYTIPGNSTAINTITFSGLNNLPDSKYLLSYYANKI